MKNEISVNGNNLPTLAEKETEGISMIQEYWTPETEGEFKRVFIAGISNEMYEREDGDSVELPCVIMLEPNEEGTDATAWKNGSKRLVAAIERAVKQGLISLISSDDPTGVQITYLGKKRNATNQYSSDKWDVRRLV